MKTTVGICKEPALVFTDRSKESVSALKRHSAVSEKAVSMKRQCIRMIRRGPGGTAETEHAVGLVLVMQPIPGHRRSRLVHSGARDRDGVDAAVIDHDE
ncbi:hypothetical protein [Bosea sp. UNC402CLCol]|uniref:hypothetical protein n=1 Tax=Bosea sp. UNC402CLCol TaxID=1510531 RepID=UPI0012E0897D|nr:hypothetical protein [Bosea sp. UNC402CLCol]